METYRLWLKPDAEIAGFQRLQYEKVEVAIADVLQKGIHPWLDIKDRSNLKDKLVEVINSPDLKIPQLAEMGYCEDVSEIGQSHFYRGVAAEFEAFLQEVQRYVYFVERLNFMDLLTLAKQRLKRKWSHKIARTLLEQTCGGFDGMRSFLKAKDKNIKISSYDDFDRCDLQEVLTLADFEGEDHTLVRLGLPVTNFRSVQCLNRVTDERGLLKLTDNIRTFRISVQTGRRHYEEESLTYNCQAKNGQVHFIPNLERDLDERKKALAIASRWRTDTGRYCFNTDIARLGQMVEEQKCEVTFPSLDYMRAPDVVESRCEFIPTKIQRYRVGDYLTWSASTGCIKAILRTHKVSMTGRKEELLDKLADLCVKVYRRHQTELDSFFSKNRFIRVESNSAVLSDRFPILDTLDLRNMILTMYILKHLRGNTILDATHHNDTFDLLSLARSLIKREVTLSGVFLKVE